jgi:organic radical activating enzyme
VKVNEIFYSIQGEGELTGTPMLFVRFADCNLRCVVEREGFDCDTEFAGGIDMSVTDVIDAARQSIAVWVLLTGGEPALQVTQELIDAIHAIGKRVAIETNGTRALPNGIDFVTVSPKTAEHTLRVERADELKYVRHHGQALPVPRIKARRLSLSPAMNVDGHATLDAIEWCVRLVKENPTWRLSLQTHKLIDIR